MLMRPCDFSENQVRSGAFLFLTRSKFLRPFNPIVALCTILDWRRGGCSESFDVGNLAEFLNRQSNRSEGGKSVTNRVVYSKGVD